MCLLSYDLAQFTGKTCSFDEDAPVVTDEGTIPIREIDVGDRVLAWNETVGETGYYTVTAVWGHDDPVTVQLVVNGETIDTTPEHPFLTANGDWVAAGELQVGDKVRNATGENGLVEAIEFAATPQVMYNMTVADAHTYTVGDGEWVVHNACSKALRKSLEEANALPYWTGRFEWRAHHVIPGKLESHPFVQQASAAGWEIDSAINGMALPYQNADAARLGLPSHRGGHPEYIDAVREALNELSTQGMSNRQARTALEDLILQLRLEIMGQPAGIHLR